jgi:hypothetical protein
VISTCRRLKLDPSLSPCSNVNSKWIKDFNVKSETEINSGKVSYTLHHLCIGNNFIIGTPTAQQFRGSTGQLDYMKLKTSAQQRRVSRFKTQPSQWEKIFASYTSYMGLIIRIYKALQKLNSQSISNTLNK